MFFTQFVLRNCEQNIKLLFFTVSSDRHCLKRLHTFHQNFTYFTRDCIQLLFNIIGRYYMEKKVICILYFYLENYPKILYGIKVWTLD